MRTTSLLNVGPAGAGGGTTARWREAPRAASARAATRAILNPLRIWTSQLSGVADDFLDPRPAGGRQLACVNVMHINPRPHPVKHGAQTEKGSRQVDLHGVRACVAPGNHTPGMFHPDLK